MAISGRAMRRLDLDLDLEVISQAIGSIDDDVILIRKEGVMVGDAPVMKRELRMASIQIISLLLPPLQLQARPTGYASQ